MNRAFLMGCVAAFGVAAFGAAAGWAFVHWLGWWGLLISVPLGLMVGNAVGRGWVMSAVVEVDDRPRTWSLPPEPGPEVTAVRCACCRARWERVSWPFYPDGSMADPGTSSVWRAPNRTRLRWVFLLLDHGRDGGSLTDASAESP